MNAHLLSDATSALHIAIVGPIDLYCYTDSGARSRRRLSLAASGRAAPVRLRPRHLEAPRGLREEEISISSLISHSMADTNPFSEIIDQSWAEFLSAQANLDDDLPLNLFVQNRRTAQDVAFTGMAQRGQCSPAAAAPVAHRGEQEMGTPSNFDHVYVTRGFTMQRRLEGV